MPVKKFQLLNAEHDSLIPHYLQANIFCLRYSTPLHDAVACGRQEVVRILLERGADVNEIDYKDMTPLRLAIRSVRVV